LLILRTTSPELFHRSLSSTNIATTQIKHFLLIAASIALPAIAAPLPNHDSSKLITPANHRVADVLTTAPAEIVIVDDMPPVVSDNGDAAAHKRSPLDPIEEKWKCADDEDEESVSLCLAAKNMMQRFSISMFFLVLC